MSRRCRGSSDVTSRLGTGALALLAGLTCTSCGWIAAEIAEQKARQDALEDHVYVQDVDVVWREARSIWRDVGCELPETPRSDETFGCDASSTKRWFRLTAKPRGYATAFESEHTKTKRGDDGKRIATKIRARDWDLEWRLLQELDPDAAADVDANAKAKGEKADKATRDLIEAFE